jgi:hypothetical protein
MAQVKPLDRGWIRAYLKWNAICGRRLRFACHGLSACDCGDSHIADKHTVSAQHYIVANEPKSFASRTKLTPVGGKMVDGTFDRIVQRLCCDKPRYKINDTIIGRAGTERTSTPTLNQQSSVIWRNAVFLPKASDPLPTSTAADGRHR